MGIFYSADPHIYHDKIISYADRPFDTLRQMHSRIKKEWNKVVGEDDDVYIAGDISIKGQNWINPIAEFMSKLNGRKHLIMGNHDYLHPYEYINKIGFTSVHYPIFRLSNGWWMVHDPMQAKEISSPVGITIIHGHVHQYWKVKHLPDRDLLNVGVDVWDFRPVSINEAREALGYGE